MNIIKKVKDERKGAHNSIIHAVVTAYLNTVQSVWLRVSVLPQIIWKESDLKLRVLEAVREERRARGWSARGLAGVTRCDSEHIGSQGGCYFTLQSHSLPPFLVPRDILI